ncbi:hypothetical protein G7076_12170 [Sphingomonas sp. HDW15A]|uniref:Pr6Pr family membrane protein n=1 Tax=Sphingomonas sp. HDW15A TaxID=2714942 RepID=UPI0014084CCD|nr:Pr6Pr family membrane protein [Sphingomonas sp. HDW15A]QIK97302.1 hypothetical protein G7076_12170 [Sphingomonas sp. HDW15A]
MARLAAALIALSAWAGLSVQFQSTVASGYSVGETLWILLRFFTVLTNIGVAVTMSLLALGKRVSPSWLGGLTLAILLVGVVYMTLLRGLLELSGGALLADTLLHKATPVLVTFWWLAFADKGSLKWRDPLFWAIYPLIYLPYALTRGAAEGIYAYPFINLADLGWSGVLASCGMITLAFLIAGFGLVALDRKLGVAPAAD